jgi:hypothetical protein
MRLLLESLRHNSGGVKSGENASVGAALHADRNDCRERRAPGRRPAQAADNNGAAAHRPPVNPHCVQGLAARAERLA